MNTVQITLVGLIVFLLYDIKNVLLDKINGQKTYGIRSEFTKKTRVLETNKVLYNMFLAI